MFPKISILLLGLMFSALLLIGCGSSVLIVPNYKNTVLAERDLRRDSVKVVKVIDNRQSAPNAAGFAQVGLFNKKVPYLLKITVSDFVANVLDSLLVASPTNPAFVPVTVFVDSFEVGERTSFFSEEGYFRSKLKFAFPVSPDSISQTSISVYETTGGMDVTNSLEELLYAGLAKSARRFVSETLDKRTGPQFVQSDQPEMTKQIDSLVLAQAVNDTAVPPSAVTTPTTSFDGGAFTYCQGDKIQSGIRATYQMFKEGKSPALMHGFGYSFTYYNVENTKDFMKGNFVNFGGRYAVRYALSEAKVAPYIGAGGTLSFGTEKIKYGSKEETTFFFGPELVEGIGLSFNNKVSIEVGTYQVALFGSKLLPSDIGFMFGFNVGF